MTAGLTSTLASAPQNVAIDTASEAWRHECEVRFVLAMPGREARGKYINGVEKRRGSVAAERLRQDISRAWQQRRQQFTTNK